MARPRENFEERFWNKVDKGPYESGCWPWIGTIRNKEGGYGCISLPGAPCRYAMAHRVAWELTGRKIPWDCELDHKCGNRRCVNPDHLQAVPHYRNLQNAPKAEATKNSAKTHCPKGHPYNYFHNGKRYCLICIKERAAAHPEATKEAKRKWIAKYRAKVAAGGKPNKRIF